MAGQAKSSDKKKRGDPAKYKNKNPRRGGPGILITCERGREFKSQREGIELISHYFYNGGSNTNDLDSKSEGTTTEINSETSKKDNTAYEKKKTKKLSLEEEISMLKEGASADQVLLDDGEKNSNSKMGKKQKAPFTSYDTGCCGTVFLICTAPNSSILPCNIHRQESDDKSNEHENKDKISTKSEEIDELQTKKRKLEETETSGKILDVNKSSISQNIALATSIWDPIKTVQLILQEANPTTSSAFQNAPSSRFITRIIPIQATCFANIEEIKNTAKFLIDHVLVPSTNEQNTDDSDKKSDKKELQKDDSRPTFSVTIKRRNCSNVTRDEIISTVAGLVDDTFKVDLKDPDYHIMIEICRTLCGMSIVKNLDEYNKFNLFQARHRSK